MSARPAAPRPVAVTGAGGFVGLRLGHHLREQGRAVRGIVGSPRDGLAAWGAGGPGGGAAAQFAEVVRFGPWYPLVLLLGLRGFFGRLTPLTPVVPVLGSGRDPAMPVALDDVRPGRAAGGA